MNSSSCIKYDDDDMNAATHVGKWLSIFGTVLGFSILLFTITTFFHEYPKRVQHLEFTAIIFMVLFSLGSLVAGMLHDFCSSDTEFMCSVSGLGYLHSASAVLWVLAIAFSFPSPNTSSKKCSCIRNNVPLDSDTTVNTVRKADGSTVQTTTKTMLLVDGTTFVDRTVQIITGAVPEQNGAVMDPPGLHYNISMTLNGEANDSLHARHLCGNSESFSESSFRDECKLGTVATRTVDNTVSAE